MMNHIGMQIGNYRLMSRIGAGGFAEVYLGEHIHFKRQAAIKILSRQFDNAGREVFLKEAQTIASLNHPNIIHLFDAGIEEAVPYLIMEYAPGGTLRQRHPLGTRLPLQTIRSYVKEITEALQYAHNRYIIHRDVKPMNMLIGQENVILLSDFGISVNFHSTHTLTAGAPVTGTVTYMAPEQFKAESYFASDQYSLAVVIYEWLCGTPPFHGTFMQMAMRHISEPPPPMNKDVSGISPDLEHVIMTALAKDPGQRYPDMETFYQAFAQACPVPSLSEENTKAPSSILPPPYQQPQNILGIGTSFPTVPSILAQKIQGNESNIIAVDPRANTTPDNGLTPLLPVMPTIAPTKIKQPSSLILINKGKTLSEFLLYKTEIVIGHAPAPTCDICLSGDKLISSLHAVIHYENKQYVIIDKHSANGTFLDRQQLEAGVSYPLKDGHHIFVGESELLFRIAKSQNDPSIENLPTIVVPLGREGETIPRTIGTRFGNPLGTIAAAPNEQSLVMEVGAEESVIASKEIPIISGTPEQGVSHEARTGESTITQYLAEAEGHYKQGRYIKATQMYEQVIQQDPHNAHAYGRMGNTLGKRKRYPEALIAYTRALDIDPKHASLWSARGDILCKLMKFDEALVAYQAALAIYPNDAQTWITYGNVLARRHRYEQAIQAYTSTLALRPSNITAWVAKCNILCKLEQHEEALKCNEEAMQAVPKKALATVLDVRGDILYNLARYEEALKAYRRAKTLAPNNQAIVEKYSHRRDAIKHLKVKEQSRTANQEVPASEQPPTEAKPDPAQHKDEDVSNAGNIHTTAPDIPVDRSAPPSPLPSHSFRVSPSAIDSEKKQDGTRIIEYYDVFLFHDSNPTDTKWVTDLAQHLEDKHNPRLV